MKTQDQERPDGYPIHWIFDFYPAMTPNEQKVCLLLFDGKKAGEIAEITGLSPKWVERYFRGIALVTNLGNHMNRRGIESGTFFKKWGFIRRQTEGNLMDDPMF